MSMKIIGITGPTGAGKTTVLNALRSLGAEVVDADEVYHRLLAESDEMKAALTAAFGGHILDGRGEVDRKRLADAVYPHRLEELNAITHPHVAAAVEERIDAAKAEGRPALAIDAIALMESGLSDRCDIVAAVLAPKELRIRRIMARDGIDEAYARRRVEAQKPDSFYRSHADYVLESREGETPEAFALRAQTIFRPLLMP